MRFEDVYGRYRSKVLCCEEAADLLGISVSSFYRWRERYEDEGAAGLADARLGRVSKRRAPVDLVSRVLELYATRYWDFTVKHFHEKLVADHGFRLSYTWTKSVLQANGCVRRAASKGAHRRKRARRPMVGMMLHQDGSRHEWVAGQWWDLIVTMDDADSRIYSAFFCAEEGTMSTFQALGEVIGAHGLFGSLYADRGSHYWTTTKAGKPDKDNPTQGPGAGPAWDRTDRCVLARGAGPLGANLRYAAGPSAAGVAACRYKGHGCCQSMAQRGLYPAPQRAVHYYATSNRLSLRALYRAQPCRHAVSPGRAHGRQRQHCPLSPSGFADTGKPAPPPLCQMQGARPRIPRWQPGRIPRTQMPCPLRCQWQTKRGTH